MSALAFRETPEQRFDGDAVAARDALIEYLACRDAFQEVIDDAREHAVGSLTAPTRGWFAWWRS